MIKANELRTGNWVIEDGEYKIFPNISIQFKKLQSLKETLSYSNLEPILLTPEILKSCGFEKSNLWGGFERNNKGAHLINNLELEEINGEFVPTINNGEYSVGIGVKYLHQFQNKYFDWYGQELEIKENAII